CSGCRYRLRATRNTPPRCGTGAWPPHRRRARHAIASGTARLRGVVRQPGPGDTRIARCRNDDPGGHGDTVIILGLTGSIGMGKGAAAAMLGRLGVPLFDADAVVHRLLGPGGAAVRGVEEAFPGVRSEYGAIDRQRLAQRVFGHPEELRRLEAILHPM